MLIRLSLAGNVRRYVALPQSRGGVFFAIVMECKISLLLSSYRISKKHDNSRSPLTVPSGAACAASHKIVHFSKKIVAAQKAIAYTDLLALVFLCIY